MKATELYLADGRTAGIFFCSQCRLVKRTKEEAEQCCQPVKCKCGNSALPYRLLCELCEESKYEAKELERFNRAEKVTEWDGWIYFEGSGYNEGYFSCVGDLIDYIDQEDDVSVPEYVWTCEERQIVGLDYDSIIEAATEDAYEDWSPDRLVGSEELKVALEKFNEANKGEVYYVPNFKRALLLNKSNLK